MHREQGTQCTWVHNILGCRGTEVHSLLGYIMYWGAEGHGSVVFYLSGCTGTPVPPGVPCGMGFSQ